MVFGKWILRDAFYKKGNENYRARLSIGVEVNDIYLDPPVSARQKLDKNADEPEK